jgi:hypothetical protein
LAFRAGTIAIRSIFPFNAQIQLVSQASCNWLHFVFFCIILKGLVLFLAATKKKKENASFFFSRAFLLAGTANALTDVITRRENTSRAENTGKKKRKRKQKIPSSEFIKPKQSNENGRIIDFVLAPCVEGGRKLVKSD